MKTVVIYKSETGFTRKYAEWIAKDLKADIFDASKVKADTLAVYDTIIFGGSLHAVGISGIKLIKRNLDMLNGKRIVVFTTGASPFKEGIVDEITQANFIQDELKLIRLFYLRGGFDYSKLKPFSKILMTLMKWKMKSKKKEELSSDERGMLAAYDKPVDFTKRENIRELVEYVKER